MGKEISDGRKAAYYIGGGLQIIGLLVFLSIFYSAATNTGDFRDFVPGQQSGIEAGRKSMMFRGLGGMGLIIAGKVFALIGAKGIAGSGVILDPKQAREDLEPYSRMAGGFVKDALNEAEIDLGREPVQVVMVRCPSCKSLNQEAAKFCQECGVKL